MRISDNKTGFTMIDHVSFDILLPTLSPVAQLLYLRIYRQTVGWKKDSDAISLSQFQAKTNYRDHKTIQKGISELKDKHLITVTGKATAIRVYSINFQTIMAMGNNPIV